MQVVTKVFPGRARFHESKDLSENVRRTVPNHHPGPSRNDRNHDRGRFFLFDNLSIREFYAKTSSRAQSTRP
ncbi:hypothetical protein, partial [Pasteurella multocida]|uniref:hypothetical protein n=1 Tax=Pasteurella multocida TaxID=747 RepID=UPI001E36B3A2